MTMVESSRRNARGEPGRPRAGQPGSGSPPQDHEKLDLDGFLPYRLSVMQLAVSRSLARIYSERFDLGRHEWRAMAVLGNDQPLTANGIAARTSMDKVQVSRAVARLIASGLVIRQTDRQDRRRALLRLTRKGRAVYRQIVPLVKAREQDLLSVLSPAELRTLNSVIGKLHRRALALLERG